MIKKKIKNIIPKRVISLLKCFRDSLSEVTDELSIIREMPRFMEGETNIMGKSLKFVDSASFCFMFDEIFKRQIYNFQTDNPTPYIIDAGANIGLSVIYFKKLFPNAEIIAFEPDPKIFGVLGKNIKSFGLNGVTLVPKALWNDEIKISFFAEGADGGRITGKSSLEQSIEIQTDRLSKYLN